MQKLKANAHWAALLAVILSIVAVTFTVTDNPTPEGGHQKTYTFKVDKSGQPGTQTQTVTVPAPVQAQIAPALEQDLRPEVPDGMTPTQVAAVDAYKQVIKSTLPPLPTAGATAGVPGCRTEFISSYSSRNGVRPVEFTLHLTVSPNVPGWADVNAVVHLFANEQASSNFVLDGEGHCAYIVPIEQKAWTQAGGNPFSVSVEVIDTGKESIYLAPAGMKQLRTIVQTVSKRTGIPIRLGAVSSSCTPIRSGVIQHKDWGVCGGGHVDITPFSVPAIVKYLRASAKPSKKVVWVKHRQQVHVTYQHDCKTRAQRTAHAAECAGLRARARQLDRLIARK